MLYGTGNYEMERNFASSPAPRVRPEAVEIAGKHRGSGMQACMEAPQISTYAKRDDKVRLSDTYGTMKHVGVRSTIPADIIYTHGDYSNRSMKPVPRVKPEAYEIAEKSKGCMDVLFGNYGKPDPNSYQMDDNDIQPKNGPLRKAGIRNPILVDPIYNQGKYSDRSARPMPRVKPEAADFAMKSKGVMGNLLVNPDVSSFKMAKPKKTPADHEKENVRRMRQIQRQSRQREREKEQNKATPVKALWKSTRYEGAEPRVNTRLRNAPLTPRAPRPSSAPPANSTGRDVGTMTVQGQQYGSSPRNFIAKNARVARSYEIGRSKSQMEEDSSKSRYNDNLAKYYNTVKGKIPIYLQNRQKQWQEADKQRMLNAPDPTVPEGHIVLPESERRDTMKVLKEKQRTLLEGHRLLPVRSADSLAVRNRKTELERQIAEVDEAVKVFERPRVFVRIDS